MYVCLPVHSNEPRQFCYFISCHCDVSWELWQLCVSFRVSSCLNLVSSWLPNPTADSIPPLTTPSTEDTILGFEVIAGPPLGATATSTTPVTST